MLLLVVIITEYLRTLVLEHSQQELLTQEVSLFILQLMITILLNLLHFQRIFMVIPGSFYNNTLLS